MKIFVPAILTALITTPLAAGTYETRCSVKKIPYQVTVGGGNTEEILGGAIIGGVIGKAATGDDGAAVAGAIIGGAVASEAGKKKVTKYREVETCGKVYIPDFIDDQYALRDSILRLNSGGSESRERIMDVQYTIGASHDGSWGPRSIAAANTYLDDHPVTEVVDEGKSALYSLIVNGVVVASSPDVIEIDEIQKSLTEAGVDSEIIVSVE